RGIGQGDFLSAYQRAKLIELLLVHLLLNGLSFACRTQASISITYLEVFALVRCRIGGRSPYLIKDVDVLPGNKGEFIAGKRSELHAAESKRKIVAARPDALRVRK